MFNWTIADAISVVFIIIGLIDLLGLAIADKIKGRKK